MRWATASSANASSAAWLAAATERRSHSSALASRLARARRALGSLWPTSSVFSARVACVRGNRVSRPEIENWSSGKEEGGSSYLEFCHLAIKLIHFLGAAVFLQP